MSKYKSLNFNFANWKIPLLTPAFYLLLLGSAIAFAGAFTLAAIPAIAQSSSKDISQAEAETIETNIETDTTEESTSDIIAEENSIEKAIIAEINRARTNPQEYANWLEQQKQYYQGAVLKLPGEKPVRISRGLRNLDEAIAFLRQQNQLSPIDSSEELIATAKQKITAITNNQISDRNNLVFDKATPEAIVMQLIVDDGFPSRPHRTAIFSQNSRNAGIICSDVAVYNRVCAIAFNNEETVTPIATQAPSSSNDNDADLDTKPEVFVTTNNNRLPTPSEVNTAESETTDSQPPETNDTPEETNSNGASETTTTDNQPPETNDTPEETNSNGALETTTTDNQPPETNDTPEETNSNGALETTTTDNQPPETNDTPEETNSNGASETTTTDNPVDNQSSETETTDISVETANNQSSETETPSEIATNSQPVEIITQGILEEGDDVIPNDGSFYDSYPLEGKPGDSFTIILESQDFDTFLAVMDRGGNIIKQNDDISEQDSNSRLEITLPENEEYSIIVNAYDRQGKGNYVLKLLR